MSKDQKEETVTTITGEAPKAFKRDERGLVVGVDYAYNEDGTINWRTMIPKDCLYPNPQNTNETDVTKLQDKDLLSNLKGFRSLLRLRGFLSVRYPTIYDSLDRCTAVCEIQWLPNFETDNLIVTTSDIASTNHGNTTDFGRLYLAEMAANRSLIRCVKAFLGITILSKEEIDRSDKAQVRDSETAQDTPADKLLALMDETGVSFEKVKARLIKWGVENAEAISTVHEIPNEVILKIMQLIRKSKKSKEEPVE